MCLAIATSVWAIDYCNGNDQETGCDVCCESGKHIQCSRTEGVSDNFNDFRCIKSMNEN